MNEILLALIAAVVTVSSAAFGWLKYREEARARADDKRFEGIEAELRRSRERVAELEALVRELERDRARLQGRLEAVEAERAGLVDKVAKLEETDRKREIELMSLRRLVQADK